MKILKKMPKWAVAVLILVLVGIMASTFVQHLIVKSHVDERKKQFQQRQITQEEKDGLQSASELLDQLLKSQGEKQ